MPNKFAFFAGVSVLIIHQHFKTPGEGGALRSYYLAEALARRGIAVTVITASQDERAGELDVDGIRVHYLRIAYNNKFGFWKRGRAFARFAWQATRLAASLPDIALCYAISVPLTVGIAAMQLKHRRNIPYIFEVGDLWPDAPIELGFIKAAVLKYALLKLERSIYRKADAIVALSEPIKAAVNKKVEGKRIHVVPNMADTTFFDVAVDRDKKVRQLTGYSESMPFVVSYIGAVGFANGLDHYIECARASQQANLNVHFFLCGDGALLDQHKANASRLGLRNLTFLPFTHRAGVKELMQLSDAIFVCYKPYRILETGSPNKYFDGLASGKLIIINFGGWIKEEIEREQCGVYVDPAYPQKFTTVIRPFIDDAALLRAYQQASRRLAEQRYSRSLLGDRFASLVLAEANRTSPGM